ncbi:hypothetical protein ZIOFF_025523 [Zingiber officinale]|uniref:Uncharacterized protein n=1 Tax=Zingiber officinale TaxID=94328 RepID=A0A8J5GV50_ZINOF|nr:hypothetical protein ZIOFF_025523 [Zingiber officinale]
MAESRGREEEVARPKVEATKRAARKEAAKRAVRREAAKRVVRREVTKRVVVSFDTTHASLPELHIGCKIEVDDYLKEKRDKWKKKLGSGMCPDWPTPRCICLLEVEVGGGEGVPSFLPHPDEDKVVEFEIDSKRGFRLEDLVENIGAELVRQAVVKTNDLAGEGTTISVVLAQGMIAEGVKVVATSACNNYEIGNMIVEALSKVERKGEVTLEEEKSAENNLYVV